MTSAVTEQGQQQTEQDRQQAFVLTIKRWKSDHLARCLVSPDVNEVAKEAIRAELLSRRVDLEKATARAVEEKAASGEPMTFRDKLLLWGPTLAIVGGLAIGLYLFTRFT